MGVSLYLMIKMILEIWKKNFNWSNHCGLLMLRFELEEDY